ncbi:hypothetical protein BCR37DRAFT_119159 [Protomyces lactucae-debilis]|uniref:Uncharacterized protein n=1 Tax=Protomyces lactucae-debilis TaxID=2754530 RepID=A0A1Y2F1E8_PROLT|nr:uncharacterized protein BCR37DRAFT_119159 [Protomyces lactucae-debilis]ORY77689.1 hypothetical protein BCR37DRAFT_119159 [Protomyces lactucae-debilis]
MRPACAANTEAWKGGLTSGPWQCAPAADVRRDSGSSQRDAEQGRTGLGSILFWFLSFVRDATRNLKTRQMQAKAYSQLSEQVYDIYSIKSLRFKPDPVGFFVLAFCVIALSRPCCRAFLRSLLLFFSLPFPAGPSVVLASRSPALTGPLESNGALMAVAPAWLSCLSRRSACSRCRARQDARDGFLTGGRFSRYRHAVHSRPARLMSVFSPY